MKTKLFRSFAKISFAMLALLLGTFFVRCKDKIEYTTTTYRSGELNILLNGEKEYLFEDADVTIEGDEVVSITFPTLNFDDEVIISPVTIDEVQRDGTNNDFTLTADNVGIKVEGIFGRATLQGTYKSGTLHLTFNLSSALAGITIEGTYSHTAPTE